MDEPNAEKYTSLECTSPHGPSWPGATLYKSLKLSWRRLRWAVVAASEAAQATKPMACRQVRGNSKYSFSEVASKVQEYSTESGDPLDTLKARLPALVHSGAAGQSRFHRASEQGWLTLGILIAALLGPIGIGALIGLGTGMAHWISHLFR